MENGQLRAKRPKLFSGFQGSVLKTVWERGSQGARSAGAQLSVDGEVTGYVSRILFVNLLVPTSQCADAQPTVDLLHLSGILVSAKRLKHMAQDIISRH